MRWLLFISRVVLLCNVCFALTMAIRYSHNFIQSEALNHYIIILGFIIAFPLNFIVNILLLVTMFSKKDIGVPSWLSITNFIFLIAQMIIFLI